MENIKTQGIVIKRFNFGETDRILTLFTRDLGKIKVLAKGLRKIKSKLAGNLEPFSSVDLILHRGNTFYTITSAQSIISNHHLGLKCQHFAKAHYFAELIDKLTEEGERNPELYDLFSAAVGKICNGQNNFLKAFFELKILDNLGFRPQLDSCVHCRQKLISNNNHFNFSDGGVACEKCRSADSIEISDDAIKVMRLIIKSNLSLVDRLNIDQKSILEVEKVLDRYQKEVLDKELKSKKILNLLEV